MKKRLGIFLGLMVFVLLLLVPPPPGMSRESLNTASVAMLMAIWWITEALHIAVTALLPLALFPLLGITTSGQAAAPYANHLIFLFMGGFILALSMQRWGLHRRIALNIIRLTGTRPSGIILGFMAATAFLSMWVSNTATTVMMVPIGLAVIDFFAPPPPRSRKSKSNHFAISLMLGIAYSASIGGIATLIGTPPNLVLANTMEKLYNKTIGFLEWLAIGGPFSLIMIPLIWLWLTRVIYPCPRTATTGKPDVIGREIQSMGRMNRGERITLAVFLLTALAWIFRNTKQIGSLTIPGLDQFIPGISDPSIAMFSALLLFIVPVNWRRGEFTMDWQHARKLPWGILILFGGGLSLANGFQVSGLSEWIGKQAGLFIHTPRVVFLLAIVTVVIFLTEMTSNTATTAMLLPVLGALAVGLGMSPLTLLIPATIAASCAFILPVATPPNAIVFGSGHIQIPQMARAGIWLNLFSILAIMALFYLYLVPVFLR